eukprot:TRINITY_DN1138_c0_g1_i3.p1 TRINITY_DN1138_c0_g1~~TRINITY_DN1138_c0_g1_i3.p1  ORF type:complete len:1018 (+),score=227.65 TRINITY_DN1138_c0_g1_i3:67-3120(+)
MCIRDRVSTQSTWGQLSLQFCVNSHQGEGALKQLIEHNFAARVYEVVYDGSNLVAETLASLNATLKNFNIRSLKLTKINTLTDDVFGAINSLDALNQLEELTINECPQLTNEGFQAFLGGALVRHLRVLNLSTTNVGDSAVITLSSQNLEKLHILDISKTKVSHQALHTLLTSTNIPNLTRINLSNTNVVNQTLVEIAQGKGPQNITELQFAGCIQVTDEGLVPLFKSNAVQNIEVLNLSGTHATAASFNALSNVTKLRNIDVSNSKYFSHEVIKILAEHTNFSSVEHLSIDKGQQVNTVLEAIAAQGSNLKNVKRIDGKILDPKAAGRFLTSQNSRSLEKLELRGETIEDPAIEPLAQNGKFKNLRVLNLFEAANLSVDLLQKVLSTDIGENLVHLGLCQTKTDDRCLEIISQSNHYKNLKCLDISYCNEITTQGIKHLANSQNFANLEILTLGGLEVEDEGIIAIAQSQHIKKLKIFMIHSTKITDAAVHEIAKSPNFRGLEILFLDSTSITDEGVKSIAQSEHLPNTLYHLSLQDCDVSEEAITEVCQNHKFLHLSPESLGFPNVFLLSKFEKLSQTPCARNIATMNLIGVQVLDEQFVSHVTNSPYYDNLRTLVLAQSCITSADALNLFQARFTANLQTLDLSLCSNIDAEGFNQLFKNADFRSLESLIVQSTAITNEGVGILGNNQTVRNLTSLDLSKNQALNAQVLQIIATAPQFRLLRTLIFESLSIDVDNMTALGSSQVLQNIDTIKLVSCMNVNLDAVQAFVEACPRAHEINLKLEGSMNIEISSYLINSKFMNNKHTLQCSEFTFNSSLINVITTSTFLQSIRVLDLSNTDLSDKDLKNLFAPEVVQGGPQPVQLHNVTTFSISGCIGITQRGFKYIFDHHQRFPNIDTFNFSDTDITNYDIKLLSLSPYKVRNLDVSKCCYVRSEALKFFFDKDSVGNLLNLDLSYTQIEDDSLVAIAASTKATNLQVINLSYCYLLNEEALAEFKRKVTYRVVEADPEPKEIEED